MKQAPNHQLGAFPKLRRRVDKKGQFWHVAPLDWSQCPAVESVPGRLGGAWVFRDTRMPVWAVFENIEAGATIDEVIEQFDVTREQISAVLSFAARSFVPASSPATKL